MASQAGGGGMPPQKSGSHGSVSEPRGRERSHAGRGAVLIVLCAPVTLITRRTARTATSQAEPTLSN